MSTTPALAPSTTRRHDLDALRAFAMLLGILLHGALSFIAIPWPVRDANTSPALGLVVSAIHGFRMPLFFMLSGYFTAMLCERHGLKRLATQRASRIALPLLVCCATVIPLMWVLVIGTSALGLNTPGSSALVPSASSQRDQPASDPANAGSNQEDNVDAETAAETAAAEPDIWTAALNGNLADLRTRIDAGEDPDAMHPVFGLPPIATAVLYDQPAAVEMLLEAGADPSQRYRDGNTPMHTAMFFGRASCVRHLLDAGADLTLRNPTGETPTDALAHGEPVVRYIAQLLSLSVDYEEVAAGRVEIRAMLDAADEAQGTGSNARPQAATEPTPANSAARRVGRQVTQLLTQLPLFHHLWFLWHLCWLISGFVVVAWSAQFLKLRMPKHPAIAVIIASPVAIVWLVPLTLVTQLQMHQHGAMPGFGPDTSASLLPAAHVLGHNAIFFGFGALLFATAGITPRIGRCWWLTLPLAGVVLAVGLGPSLRLPGVTERFASDDTLRLFNAVTQALFVWLTSFGLFGLFEAALGKGRGWVRYLSDASYWLYIAHLPVVILGQAALRPIDLPAPAKLIILVCVVTALLLASYHLAVRYTFIGTMLNGRRSRPKPASDVPPASTPHHTETASGLGSGSGSGPGSTNTAISSSDLR
ncbi:MAG: acyltransferase family protein [Planctomycetota bacterium]